MSALPEITTLTNRVFLISADMPLKAVVLSYYYPNNNSRNVHYFVTFYNPMIILIQILSLS